MPKLIVNAPNGFQEIIEVEKSGGYFDKSLVVWDERENGVLDADTISKLGGLSRSLDGSVQFDKPTQDAQIAAKLAKKNKDDSDKQNKQVARSRLALIDLTKNLSTNEVQEIVKDLVQLFVK